MAVMGRNLISLLWAAMCVYGCGTASTGKDNWAYTGPDAKLKSPPRISKENLTPEALQQRFRENLEAWEQERRNVFEAVKDTRARETGDGRTPGYWRGYSDAFMACMKAQGWIRVSNPL
jgi:hypothetical protein